MRFVGITRGKRFSPNMSDNDMAVMQEVSKRLYDRGHEVWLVSEDDCLELEQLCQLMPDAIFTMLRGDMGLNCLRRFESQGIPTLNSADAIGNAHRSRITRILSDNRFPIPNTMILDNKMLEKGNKLLAQLVKRIKFPCWVKNGLGWAQLNEDVAFMRTPVEAFRQIGLNRQRYPNADIIICEHLNGDLVKFYGVEGTDFFCWNYPDPSHSKFGIEAINGKPARFKFDEQKLKNVCDSIAALSAIVVYGGDCVVNSDGDFKIIDFNDWPSFSSCRETAAEAIALRLLNLLQYNA